MTFADDTRHQTGSARSTSTVALGLVSLVSPLATDAYLPALPQLQLSLGTSSALVQGTLTAFVLGFAGGQLIAGPLSDSSGRRRFVVWGAAAFTLATLLCAAAPSIQVLLAARVLQGITGGSALAASRGMVTDRFDATTAARRFATLYSLMTIGPILAPALGSAALAITSWRGIFVGTAVLGALMTVAALAGLPETLGHDRRDSAALSGQLRRFGDLLRDVRIRRLLLSTGLGSAAVYVYLGTSPFVFQRQLHLSASSFGLVFATNAVLMATGGLGFRSLVGRMGPARLQLYGTLISIGALSVLVVAAIAVTVPPTCLVWSLLGITLVGSGLGGPANTVRMQDAGRRSAGTAAALTGAAAYLAGAVTAPLSDLTGAPVVESMTALMVACYLLQTGVLVRLRAHDALRQRTPPPQENR